MKKVYCSGCKFLEKRNIEVNGKNTGARYYCNKNKKWFSIGSTIKEIGFSFCGQGEQANDKL